MAQTRQSRWLHIAVAYSVAVLAALLAVALRWGFHPLLGGAEPFVFVFPAILIASMIGGLGPGLLCLALSFSAALYLFEVPPFAWQISNISGMSSALFVAVLILIAAVMQRNARLAAMRARLQAQQHARRLEDEIAQRQRAEEDLRQSEEKLRLLVESATEYAIITFDLDNRITTWNVGAERILGYEESEILGKSGLLIFTPEDREEGRVEHELRIARDHGRAVNERWHLRKDGIRFWGSGMMMPLLDASGEHRGYVKIFNDRTARREAEMALRESEERYRRLTELNPDAVMVGIDAQIVYANVAAQRLLGASSVEELIGRNVYDFIHPDDRQRSREHVTQMRESGQPGERYDKKMLRLDGSEFEAETVAAPVPWKGRTAIQVILHDITERKLHEESLRRANDLHRLLLRELDHRVRNNLASLISLIDITASGKSNVNEVSVAIRSRAQAMAAVHQLLSRQHFTTVNLQSLVDSMQPPSAPGTIEFQGPHVLVAARQVTALGMVLQELFSNSAKYGALSVPGGVVHIHWNFNGSRKTSTERSLQLSWQERGGPPPASAQPTPGVGTGLITGFVRSELRGEATLEYPPEGATHHFTIRLDPISKLARMVA